MQLPNPVEFPEKNLVMLRVAPKEQKNSLSGNLLDFRWELELGSDTVGLVLP